MKYFYANGAIHPLEESEEGLTIPQWARQYSGDEGSDFRMLSDDENDEYARQQGIQQNGFDMSAARWAGNEQAMVQNPATGQVELIVNTPQGPMLTSQAEAAGIAGTPLMKPKETGNVLTQFMELSEGPRFLASVAGGAGLVGNGLNALLSGGMDGLVKFGTDTVGNAFDKITNLPDTIGKGVDSLTSSVTNGAGTTSVAGYGVTDMTGFQTPGIDWSAGLPNNGVDTSFLTDPSFGYQNFGTDPVLGAGLGETAQAFGGTPPPRPTAEDYYDAQNADDAAVGANASGVPAPIGSGIGGNTYGTSNPFTFPPGMTQVLGAAGAAAGAGGATGGPVAGTSTTSQSQTFTPEQTAARQRMLEQAQQLFQQNAGATFPGAAPVAPSADTVAGQNAVRSFATGQGQMTADQIAKAMQFGLSDVLNPESNPALKSTLDTGIRRIGEAYTDPGGVISNIRTNFTAGNSGGTGTRESIAGGLAAKSYLNTIGDYTGKVTSDAYSKGLDTFSKTLAFAPNSYSLMMQPGVTQGAVGAQIDAQNAEQAKYTADSNSWNLQYPWQNLNSYAGVVNGTGSPTTTTTATSPEAQKNPLAPVGGAMLGTQIANMAGVSPLYGAAAGLLFGLM